MHKKIQSLVLAGIILINIFSSAITVFANNVPVQENIKIETIPEEDIEEGEKTPSVEGIVNEGGTGGRNTPYILKLNTEEGLNQLFNVLNDKDKYTDYYRLKDTIDDTDTTTYQFHLFTNYNMVIYVNIKVDSNKSELIKKLKDVKELINAEQLEEGDGTKDTPHKVKVNTIGGINRIIEWIRYNYGYNYYRSEIITEDNETKVYEIYVPIETNSITYSSNNYVCIRIVVDSNNDEVLDYLNNNIEVVLKDNINNTLNTTPDNNTGTNINELNYGEEYAPQESEWKTFSTESELVGYWDYEKEYTNGKRVVLLKNYIGASKNTKVEIPREINGMPVELANFNTDVFQNVTHIRVAKGNDNNRVKLRTTTLKQAFLRNEILEYVDLRGLDISNITELYSTFDRCINLKYLDLSRLNISNINDLSYFAYNCSSLQYLNLSGWEIKNDKVKTQQVSTGAYALKHFIFRDTDSFTFNKIKNSDMPLSSVILMDVTNMEIVSTKTSLIGMFKALRSVTKITGLETWKNTKEITSMKNMFLECNSLTEISGMRDWDLSNLTSTAGMFKECTALKTLDVSIFDMNNVKYVEGMFQDCINLEEIKGTEGWKLSNVQSMYDMFRRCNSLRFIDFSSLSLSPYANINMDNMFDTDNNEYLLIVTNESKLKNYKFKDDKRMGSRLTFDANGGQLNPGQAEKSDEIFVIDSVKNANLEGVVQNEIDKRAATKVGFEFVGWTPVRKDFSQDRIERAFQMLNNTYTAEWAEGIISVTVPIKNLSFQVDPALANQNQDPFVFKDLNIKNNSITRPVNVSVKEFTEETFDLPDGYHKLDLLDPNETNADGDKLYGNEYWDNLEGDKASSEMAIGIYPKSGVNNGLAFTKENPLWLTSNTPKTKLGIIPAAQSKDVPHEAELSFSAKHAKVNNFGSIKSKGKFKLILVFE